MPSKLKLQLQVIYDIMIWEIASFLTVVAGVMLLVLVFLYVGCKKHLPIDACAMFVSGWTIATIRAPGKVC